MELASFVRNPQITMSQRNITLTAFQKIELELKNSKATLVTIPQISNASKIPNCFNRDEEVNTKQKSLTYTLHTGIDITLPLYCTHI